MKSLYKKIGAMALAGMMIVGGFAASEISAHASGVSSISSNRGGLHNRAIMSAFYEYEKEGKGKSKLYFEGFYSHLNNNDYSRNAVWMPVFDCFNNIGDFLDYAARNQIPVGQYPYKAKLQDENVIIVFYVRR